MFNLTEQQCLMKLELEEIQRRTEDKSHGYVPNDS